jgi:hypothetical protein
LLHCSIIASLFQNNDAVPAPLERSLDGISETGANAITNNQPIDHRLNRVPFVLVKPDPLGAIQFHNSTVNPRAHESFAPDFLYYVPKLPWLILNQRCQQNDFRVRFVSKNLIDNLLGRLPAQRLARQRIMRLAYSRKEDP